MDGVFQRTSTQDGGLAGTVTPRGSGTRPRGTRRRVASEGVFDGPMGTDRGQEDFRRRQPGEAKKRVSEVTVPSISRAVSIWPKALSRGKSWPTLGQDHHHSARLHSPVTGILAESRQMASFIWRTSAGIGQERVLVDHRRQSRVATLRVGHCNRGSEGRALSAMRRAATGPTEVTKRTRYGLGAPEAAMSSARSTRRSRYDGCDCATRGRFGHSGQSQSGQN
jgi:hypothetical protein